MLVVHTTEAWQGGDAGQQPPAEHREVIPVTLTWIPCEMVMMAFDGNPELPILLLQVDSSFMSSAHCPLRERFRHSFDRGGARGDLRASVCTDINKVSVYEGFNTDGGG